ncbi:hypothetical protein F0562_028256 [Nyssa sinensis]|uniref:EF-hand domain-containing protein n=1 Tax=Nyssa sinensis TaxID=561372 RepID=A0A5J5B7U7_9ASTE|nr:hypothetical protein F0562_028256 [Nyssa sinensis]
MAQVESLSAEMETMSHVMCLVEAFKAFDSDNDGYITAAELGGIVGSLGCNRSEQEVKAMMQQGDTNRDGLLSMPEFLDMNTKEMDLGTLGTSLRRAFEALDVDGDETAVTGDELYDAMGGMGLGLSLEACRDIIASMDGDAPTPYYRAKSWRVKPVANAVQANKEGGTSDGDPAHHRTGTGITDGGSVRALVVELGVLARETVRVVEGVGLDSDGADPLQIAAAAMGFTMVVVVAAVATLGLDMAEAVVV